MTDSSARTILIIDDHVETTQLLAALLSRRGMQVLAVCDSEEAMQLLRHGLSPALVVTDFMMPKLTGLDLIAQIRTHPSIDRIPVVLLSAMRVAESGDPYTVVLRKPFEPEAFVDLVAELLDVSQAACA